MVLEKTLESPLDCKIKPVNPKGNQSWILIGKTDAEAETPMFWPPDGRSQLTGRGPDAGNGWGQEEMVKDKEARRAAAHVVVKSQTQPSNWRKTTIIVWVIRHFSKEYIYFTFQIMQ